MTRTTALQVLLLVAGALGASWVIGDVLFAPAAGRLDTGTILVGLGFGGALAVVITRVPRRVAGLASVLLLLVAAVDARFGWPLGISVRGWVSGSVYLWITIAALGVRGVLRPATRRW